MEILKSYSFIFYANSVIKYMSLTFFSFNAAAAFAYSGFIVLQCPHPIVQQVICKTHSNSMPFITRMLDKSIYQQMTLDIVCYSYCEHKNKKKTYKVHKT